MNTTLTQDEFRYSQQKNKEYIYIQAKNKFISDFMRQPNILSDYDSAYIDQIYVRLCQQANIIP